MSINKFKPYLDEDEMQVFYQRLFRLFLSGTTNKQKVISHYYQSIFHMDNNEKFIISVSLMDDTLPANFSLVNICSIWVSIDLREYRVITYNEIAGLDFSTASIKTFAKDKCLSEVYEFLEDYEDCFE